MPFRSKFHRLFTRQLNKYEIDIDTLPDNLKHLLISMNDSFIHLEENRMLIERAMRISSEELQEKNEQLRKDSQKQQVLIDSFKKIFKNLSPTGEEIQDNDLMAIAAQITAAIEERKALEHELIRAREIAESSLETRKIFLANISHEVRTPLNAIIGMSMIMGEGELNTEQKEYLEAIRASGEGLLVIINDILDLTKMESGKLELEQIPFSIDHVMKPVMRGFGVKAQQKNIQLHYEKDYSLPDYFIGDPTRLVQVISNLISNALKFTHEGQVRLSISNNGVHENNYSICFKVEDSGIGIEENKLESIFQEFTQADVSINRRYGGTGLGLPIARNIVQTMGGQLHVRSVKGKGSSFMFCIQLEKTERPEKKQETHILQREISNVTALLVEDNEINRFLATTLLKKWKVNYDVANDGLDAIPYLKKNKYDVVLMDLQMPGADGFQCTRVIRDELGLDVPIIALTANALESERLACLNSGMTDYLSKPYNPEDLYEKIIGVIQSN